MNPIWVVGLVGGVVMVGFGVERMFIKGVVVGVTCGNGRYVNMGIWKGGVQM